MDRFHLLKSLQQTIAVARSRETTIRTMCDASWCRKRRFLSAESLIRKFKFVVGNCKFSTIYVMFKKGLFCTPELKEQVAQCIKCRKIVNCSRMDEIMRGKWFFSGYWDFLCNSRNFHIQKHAWIPKAQKISRLLFKVFLTQR